MIIIFIVTALLILIFAASYLSYRKAFYVPQSQKESVCAIPSGEQYECVKDKILSLIKEMDELTFESVFITSFDGVKLYARYYHVRDGAPLQIQFHGYRGSALRDFCGGHKLARELGHNILAVDQRAHGKSGGNTITFGIKERYDCLCWVKYALERFGKETPIFLSGVSMGAATVLMASELNLPENVVGIIADSPYSSPEEIIRKVCKEDMGLPPAIAMFFIRLGAKVFGHFDLKSADAINAVHRTKIPILLLHGESDLFVPCDMSKKIEENASGRILRETFPNAGHGISYIIDPDRYSRITIRFIEECLMSQRKTDIIDSSINLLLTP